MSMTTTSIRLPDQLKTRYEILAKATGRSKNYLMIEALVQYVDNEAWQIEQIEDGLRQFDAGEFATDREMQELWDRVTTSDGMERARAAARQLYGA